MRQPLLTAFLVGVLAGAICVGIAEGYSRYVKLQRERAFIAETLKRHGIEPKP